MILNNVKYVLDLHFNLLTLSKAMKVFELKGMEDQLTLRYKNLQYQFDQKIKSRSGILYSLRIITSTNNKRIPYYKAHKLLVHANSTVTKATMKKMGYCIYKNRLMQTLCRVKVKAKRCA